MNVIFVSPGDDLQAVLDTAPENARILLTQGVYRQKLMIRTRGIALVGAGAGKTVLVYDDHARKAHPIGGEFNTFRTYTLAVCADGVRIQDLTVANDAGDPKIKGQEVALSVCGTDFRMENCTLTSTQDTLFLGPLPNDLIGRYEGFLPDPLRRGGRLIQRFQNCRIEGSVDFIFGCGETLFEDCEIRSVADGRNIGYVAAPAHHPTQKEGFRFLRCRFTADADVDSGSVYLARPWRDYGLAIFEDCSYGAHIAAAGFDPWSGTERDKTARFYEIPAVPGRVPWANRP